MSLRVYIVIWVLITGFLTFEYWALNYHPEQSVFKAMQAKKIFKATLKISPRRGGPVSLWLGWAGLGLMTIMNIYSIRKHFGFMAKIGVLGNFLNFHIFCGLLGPTFIVFHSNFELVTIVKVAFWCMMVSVSSGVVGRYLYLQMAGKRADYEASAEQWSIRLNGIFETHKLNVDADRKERYKGRALLLAGGLPGGTPVDPLSALLFSVQGDIRVMFSKPRIPEEWPKATQGILLNYAMSRRKAMYLEPYQRLMGYWHMFHAPFAIVMYIISVAHVVVALLFQV